MPTPPRVGYGIVTGAVTAATVGPGNEKFAAVQQGLRRLNVDHAAACARCPDYVPED